MVQEERHRELLGEVAADPVVAEGEDLDVAEMRRLAEQAAGEAGPRAVTNPAHAVARARAVRMMRMLVAASAGRVDSAQTSVPRISQVEVTRIPTFS